jgi:hypothetical protein
MNLLVLAKEQHICTSCSVAAAYSGMSVTAVATAQEAVVIIDGSDVDILIADLKLCESGGLNVNKAHQAGNGYYWSNRTRKDRFSSHYYSSRYIALRREMSARLVPDVIADSSEQLIHYDGPGMCGQVKRATIRSLLKPQPTKSLPTGLKAVTKPSLVQS